MSQDLMDLIGQLQERYGIEQQDVDVLVGAIQEEIVGGTDEVGAAMADQGIPPEEMEGF